MERREKDKKKQDRIPPETTHKNPVVSGSRGKEDHSSRAAWSKLFGNTTGPISQKREAVHPVQLTQAGAEWHMPWGVC